ncbi:hypothetical protein DFQ28_004897 [Apophysomyces sp. BC1034]|nr:hypothetical protein DFQ28_004897 [Apophysomyces sp. BC1034]
MTQCRVLMVAEKPSLAESLSRLLAPGGKYETTKATTPVHEWIGTFQDQPAKFHFTSVTGHVYQIDFVQEFNSWDVDPQKLFDARTKKTEANPKMRLTQHLQREAKGVDYLVLWLDCDREGENICFEVIENCLPYMKQLHKADQVLRARFSAITAQEIQKSIKNLVKPNENEAKAVDARQEFDLKVGVAFTRFQTKFFQGKYGNLDSTVISSGPCQTPTLSFCVERHDRIQSFQPESYWSISATIKRNDIPTKLVWERERMGLAERLYMQGYISYPRTETSKYPESFDIDFVLREQAQHSMWGDYCHDLLAHGFDRPTGGTDIGDHPPITPIHIAEESELPGNAWRLYEFIARTFIGSISPNLQYISTKVVFSIGDESFECKGSRVTSPGFTSIMHWLNKADEYIPEFKKDDILPISALVIQEGKTGPPDYLTESELIGLMIERMDELFEATFEPLAATGKPLSKCDVEMVDELCDCGASILKAEFRENQNKQPISGCIMCDEDMDTLLVTRHMHDTHQIQVSDEVTFFKLHDLDGDGFWDDRELRAMYGLERDIDPNAVHVKTIINRAFEELDTGRDGLISLTEYMRSKLPNWTEEEKKAEKRWKEEHQDEKATTLHQRSLHDDLPQWEEDKAEEGEGVVPDKYRA